MFKIKKDDWQTSWKLTHPAMSEVTLHYERNKINDENFGFYVGGPIVCEIAKIKGEQKENKLHALISLGNLLKSEDGEILFYKLNENSNLEDYLKTIEIVDDLIREMEKENRSNYRLLFS
jgi:hypothetical protein